MHTENKKVRFFNKIDVFLNKQYFENYTDFRADYSSSKQEQNHKT